MKAKFLVSAMALPLLFACTNEMDFDAENQVSAERIPLGEVTIDFNDQADTRLAVGGNGFNQNALSFIEGDEVGACLIDVYAAPNDNDTLKYTLTSGIQTNYRYSQDAETGAWTTPANMVEGNYMFYAPYNEEIMTREGVGVAMPQIMELSKDASGFISAIPDFLAQAKEDKFPVVAGYKFLSADDEDGNKKIAVTLNHLYAYPYFTVENIDDENALTIQKIVIRKADGFMATGTLKLGTANATANVFGDTDNQGTGLAGKMWSIAGVEFGVEGGEMAKNVWESSMAYKAATPAATAYTSEIIDAAAEKHDVIVLLPGEGCKTIAAATSATEPGTYSFAAVLPAEAYSAADIVVDVYTDQGVLKATQGAIKFAAGKYDHVADHAASADGEFASLTQELQERTEPLPYVVVDNDDLKAVIAAAADDATITVSALSAVKINNEIMAAKAADQTLVFSGTVAIEGGATEAAALVLDETIEFANATIESGYVKWNGATVTNLVNKGNLSVAKTLTAAITNSGTLNVAKALAGDVTNAGTLTTAANITGTIYNGGTFTLAAAEDLVAIGTLKNGWASSVATKQTNTATATISTDKFTFEALHNYASLTFTKKNTTAVAITNYLSAVESNKYTSSLNIKNGAKLTIATGSDLSCDINIETAADTLNLAAALTCAAAIDNNGSIEGSALTVSKSLVNDGVISAALTISADATMTNNATAMNITSNAGTIDCGTASKTIVTTNTGVINWGNKQFSVNTNNGYVVYTTPEGFAAADLANIPTHVNYLKVTKAFDYSETTPTALDADVTTVEFAGVDIQGSKTLSLPNVIVSGEVEISANLTLSENLTFAEESSTTIYSDIAGEAGKTITVDEDAVVYNFGNVHGFNTTVQGTGSWQGQAVTNP